MKGKWGNGGERGGREKCGEEREGWFLCRPCVLHQIETEKSLAVASQKLGRGDEEREGGLGKKAGDEDDVGSSMGLSGACVVAIIIAAMDPNTCWPTVDRGGGAFSPFPFRALDFVS